MVYIGYLKSKEFGCFHWRAVHEEGLDIKGLLNGLFTEHGVAGEYGLSCFTIILFVFSESINEVLL